MNNYWVQRNLNFLGFDCGKADGIAGNRTKSAIKDFQRNYGNLIVDGIAGPRTIKKLSEIIFNIQTQIGAKRDALAGDETIRLYNKKFNEVAKHFTQKEFKCSCCTANYIDIQLVAILETIRSEFNDNPITITSGHRCYKHNISISGSSQKSRHVRGKAVDFYVHNISTSDVLDYCNELVKQGVLRYCYTNNTNMRGAIHIDIM